MFKTIVPKIKILRKKVTNFFSLKKPLDSTGLFNFILFDFSFYQELRCEMINFPKKNFLWNRFKTNSNDILIKNSWFIPESTDLLFFQIPDFQKSINKPFEKFSTKKKEDLIFKNCETVSGNFISKASKLFSFRAISSRYHVRVSSILNRWYSNKNFFLSINKPDKKFSSRKEHTIKFTSTEPLVRKINFSPKEEKNFSFFGFDNTNISILTKILNIHSGSFFQWDSFVWENKFKKDLFRDGQVTFKSLKIPQKGDFLDLFVEMKKVPTKNFEPEVSLSNESLSGSVSFSDCNFLGLGLILRSQFSKNNRKNNIFRMDLNSHFKESGTITWIHEKRAKKDTGMLLKVTKNFKKNTFYPIKLDLVRKYRNQKKKESLLEENIFSVSFLTTKIDLRTNFFFSQGGRCLFFPEEKKTPSFRIGFLFEEKNFLFPPLRKICGVKMKIVNLLNFDFPNSGKAPRFSSQAKPSNDQNFFGEVISNSKGKTLVEFNSNFEKIFYSSVFFETDFDLGSPDKLKKKAWFRNKIKKWI